MAIIKCKMCGGDIELTSDKTFGACEFCGSTITLPKIDDDQRAAAFNRGNHFRRIGEFDKALAAYERILREDDTDAEAHWCAALCRFGIEYVEDPATFEWLPTCHRASFDSFLEDVDYLAAVEHSSGLTQRLYRKEGAKIVEVQKGILATSQNEKPYDVFICYKETDDSGERTRDSMMAQEIYYALTEQGLRVFFSRITLEDRAGSEYEPYIFAALSSARVMVAVGTKPEHFSAVWVKNEWSRFLALMRKDRSRVLLPCYRDMDPYDLPEALSVLQSYDMSKIGFIQDLTRGISKVLDVQKAAPATEAVVVQQSGSGNMVALLKRGNLALEDGEWQRADQFFEEVLNQDAECAHAYLGKLLSQFQLHNPALLSDCKRALTVDNLYQKALRFGDEALTTELQSHAKNNRSAMLRHSENLLRNGEWKGAVRLFGCVLEEDETCTAAHMGNLLAYYKLHSMEELESAGVTFWENNPHYARVLRCADAELAGRLDHLKASTLAHMQKNVEQQRIYDKAITMTTETDHLAQWERLYGVKIEKQLSAEDLLAAANLLATIPDYRDAAALAASYRRQAEEMRKEKIYREALLTTNSPDVDKIKESIRKFETILDYKDAAQRIELCKERIVFEEQMEYKCRDLCRHCGGKFIGLFSRKCSVCGKPKDY